MPRLSNLPKETTFALTDYLLKVKASGAGDVLVKLSDFLSVLGLGYHFMLTSGVGTNPADATTYFWGGAVNAGLVNTTDSSKRQTIPKNGTIIAAYGCFIVEGTLGSNENATVYIEKNGSTDTTLTTTQQFTAANNTFAFTGLNIPVTAGNQICGKLLTPTWATNPTSVFAMMDLFIAVN